MDILERRATAALASVLAERERQDAKWGVQDHAPHFWAVILAEECGEFAREAIRDGVLDAPRHCDGPDREALAAARAEAVQAAAVALAIVECLDRDRWWRRG